MTRKCCDQNFGGSSHYHCGRCREVSSMYGHYVQLNKPGWSEDRCKALGLPFPFVGFTCDPTDERKP